LQQCFCFSWQNEHWLVKFWKCQKASSILPQGKKTQLELICLQTIIFVYSQNSSSSAFASRGKIKIHGFKWVDRTGSDRLIQKFLQFRTGSALIFWIRIGLRVKNFTVRLSLVACPLGKPINSKASIAIRAVSPTCRQLASTGLNHSCCGDAETCITDDV